MVNVKFGRKNKSISFKDLEQGACFTHVTEAKNPELFMKIIRHENSDAYAKYTIINAIRLNDGKILSMADDTPIIEYDIEIIACEVK